MNGELALMAALVAWGGRWLREGGRGPAPDLLATNSSFQYVSSFDAEIPKRGVLRRSTSVSSPAAWLQELRDGGVTDLVLVSDLSAAGPLPSHIASSFANAGSWAMVAVDRRASTLWVIRWEVGDRQASNSRIWSLHARFVPGERFELERNDITQIREQLRASLAEIRSFSAATQGLGSWASWFAEAESALDTSAPMARYHADLLPADSALERRQLVTAAIDAWVFGGMGSWNDEGPTDPAARPEYERLGTQLYSALLVAIAAAVNGA